MIVKKEYNTDKNTFMQLCRGVAIIAVVWIHCSWEMNHDNSFNFFYSLIFRQFLNFAVGMFVFFAGYFINTNKICTKKYFVNRLKRLIIPYLFWTAVNIGIRFAAGNYASIKEIFGMILFGTSVAQLYYIIVLLQLTLLTPVIIKLDSYKYARMFLWAISPVYYLCMYYLNFQIPLRQTVFPVWFIFYYAGLKAKKTDFKPTVKKIICMTIFTLIISVIESLILYQIYGKYSMAVTQIKISSVLYALSVIGLILSLKEMKISSNNIFVRLGYFSYGIFYIHTFALKIVNTALSFLAASIPLILLQCIQLVLSLLISCFMIIVLKKLLKENAKYIGC